MTLSQVFLVVALVLFVLAAFWRPQNPPRVALGWLGAAFVTLAQLVSGVHLP